MKLHRIEPLLVIIILFYIPLHSQYVQKISNSLLEKLKNSASNDKTSCIVMMKEKHDYDAVSSFSIREKIARYKSISSKSQRPVMQWLTQRKASAEVYQKYWVFNGFHLKATPAIIYEIAQREDVGFCGDNVQFYRDVVPSKNVGAPPIRGIAWGVKKVGADKCWDLGYTGEGVVVGIIDGGVQYEHPAFEGKWTGYWIPTQGCDPSPTPYDMTGHGSHCLGSILGGDGPGPFEQDIGVAPGAKYAAGATKLKLAQCFEALQYMASLSDSCNIRAVSSSWTSGTNPTSAPQYIEVCKTMLSLNIVNLFCNGNVPTQRPGSVWLCGSLPNVIGVGNVDSADQLNPSSALGPAPDNSIWTDKSNWLRGDWSRIKPNITAPGTDIWSCSRTSGYIYKSGTSMATPHVAGAIALICQKNPNLTPKEIYDILLKSTDQPSHGGPYPNNNFGWGRLNVYKAIQSTPIAHHVNNSSCKSISLTVSQRHNTSAIHFSLKKERHVQLHVYDAGGVRISKLIDTRYPAGDYTVILKIGNRASGTYFCILSLDNVKVAKKVVLFKR